MPPHPKEVGRKLLEVLLEGKDAKALELLKQKVDFNVECKGDNPVHLAARNGKLEILQQMKNAGVNLKQRNMHGNTAMHYAARGGYLDMVKYLKENGVNVNTANDDGETPLDRAITCQTMNIIEALVDMGMNPNEKNKKTGETPLFTALRAGAQEAMEGLLIKGAKPGVKNDQGQKAEDVALNKGIRDSLKMYTTLLIALSSGNIKAKGMKISRQQYTPSMVVDRVGVVLEKFDIPREFPAGFYCRREKAENATIQLKKFDEESIFSDVFHIRIFEVNRDCPVHINLPLYKAPSDKEQMVLRFYNCALEDREIDEGVVVNKIPYCPFAETLIPETNYICVVYIRPKKEEKKIGNDASKITSEIEKDFALDIPEGSFEGETVLSLQVYETNEDDNGESVDDEFDEAIENKENASLETDANKEKSKAVSKRSADDKSTSEVPAKKPVDSNLLTDVYQINVTGQQPKKGLLMQIPLAKGMTPDDDIAIVAADENKMTEDNLNVDLEVLPGKPKLLGTNLIFEVSHFSMYVATWKKNVDTKAGKHTLQRQISSAKERKKPAVFFAVVKKDIEDKTGLTHAMIVECGLPTKSEERRDRWVEYQSFKVQTPTQSEDIVMAPGDTFFASLTGNATMDDADQASEKKIQFSPCRASYQAYQVFLNEGIYDEAKATANVVICKKVDNRVEKVAELQIKLVPPPRPVTPPQSNALQLKVQNFINKPRDYKPPSSVKLQKAQTSATGSKNPNFVTGAQNTSSGKTFTPKSSSKLFMPPSSVKVSLANSSKASTNSKKEK